jgi:toxin ParE1/3/4
LTIRPRQELINIGDYIALDNPNRAASFIEELQNKAASIMNFPYLYPVIKTDDEIEIRRCNHKKYAIFYEIRGGVIFIKHVYHSARNIKALV